MPDLEYTILPVRKRVIKVTISNNQSTATANPHVQEIKIDHNYLLSLLGLGIDPYVLPLNTIFYDPQANAQAYSWYEQFDGTYHRWFVKTQSIGANSTYTLYMIIDIMQQLVDGNYAGINAIYGQNSLGLSYGQLDNGKNVFLFYDNFQGTSINTSNWYVGGSDNNTSLTTFTVNNGLTITSQYSSSTGSYGGIVTVNSYPTSTIFDAYLGSFSVTNSSYNSAHGISAQTGSASSSNGYDYVSWNVENPNGGTIAYGSISGGLTAFTAGPNFPKLNSVLSVFWTTTGNEGACVNYNCVQTNNTSVTNTGSNYYAIGAFNNSQGAISTWYYARLRDYPPNGVMPAIALSLID
jgi:hypothetical protein